MRRFTLTTDPAPPSSDDDDYDPWDDILGSFGHQRFC